MTKHTNQSAFDCALAHMMRQTEQAADTQGSCVYYAPQTGNTCAVGCLLPLELAKALSEARFVNEDGGSWNDVCAYSVEQHEDYDSDYRTADPVAEAAAEELSDVSDNLLSELQRVHDSRRAGERTDDDKLEMLQELKAIAKRFGLEYK